MNALKILIVEDEVLIADYIASILDEQQYTNVKMAHTIAQAQDQIANFVPDVILLDINVEGPDTGITLAANKNPEAKIIYITAQNDSETIQKAIATQPESYLTKPIKKADLLAALSLLNFKTKHQTITVRVGYANCVVNTSDILYIKSDGNYIDIVTQSKTYTSRQSLDSILQQLNHELFCKIHRSYIINKTKITKKETNTVFINNTALPISRSAQLQF